jgi:hypothetical protein
MIAVRAVPRLGPHPELLTFQCLSCREIETGTSEWFQSQVVGRQIGGRLREYYKPVISEAVPDRFLDLLGQTEKQRKSA